MLDWLKRQLGKKEPQRRFGDDEWERHYELKKRGLEKVLGEMYELVGHAIIPFQIGGAVDMYYFPNCVDGTGFATMELIEPDGSGPRPSRIGTYELVAFTKHRIGDKADKDAFEQMARRMCGILTTVGHYAHEAKLTPRETAEVPVDGDKPHCCLMFDEYRKPGVDFMIGSRKHGLLLVMEVFRSEMEYAMNNGTQIVLDKLKERGYYPYSDLDREPVF